MCSALATPDAPPRSLSLVGEGDAATPKELSLCALLADGEQAAPAPPGVAALAAAAHAHEVQPLGGGGCGREGRGVQRAGVSSHPGTDVPPALEDERAAARDDAAPEIVSSRPKQCVRRSRRLLLLFA